MAVSRDPAPLQPWQRAPFTPGNEAGLRHGGYSPRKVDELTRSIVESLAGVADYLEREPAFAASVWGWARAEARLQLVSEWLDENGLLDAKGRPRPAAALVVKLERQAQEARDRLGLSPLARARLGRDVAGARFDLARAWAQAAEAEQESTDDPAEA